MQAMKKFIIGYSNDDSDELTEFNSEKEADINSEEWVSVDALSLSNAKSKYESAFNKWKNKQNGNMTTQ